MQNKIQCSEADCSRLGTRYPIIRVPAKGWALDQHKPLELTMGVAWCGKHCRTMTVQNFLLPEGKARIAAALAAMGKVEPDFDRAMLKWGRVGDEGWLTFHQVMASGETRQ